MIDFKMIEMTVTTELTTMAFGLIMGLVVGYTGGRANPSRMQLRMAYLQGRIDHSSRRDEPEDKRYRG
jgi:hypothetical protein